MSGGDYYKNALTCHLNLNLGRYAGRVGEGDYYERCLLQCRWVAVLLAVVVCFVGCLLSLYVVVVACP